MVQVSQRAEQDSTTLGYWCMSFTGTPKSVSDVRRYLESVLGRSCGIEPLIVASELATNAINHTASGGVGGQFVLHIDRYHDQIGIRVDDQGGPNVPQLLDSEDLEDSGRGLALVARLCLNWGVRGDERSRTVWAVLALPSEQAVAINQELESRDNELASQPVGWR